MSQDGNRTLEFTIPLETLYWCFYGKPNCGSLVGTANETPYFGPLEESGRLYVHMSCAHDHCVAGPNLFVRSRSSGEVFSHLPFNAAQVQL